jgi:MFS transporter, putative metabolite:H+ symporter
MNTADLGARLDRLPLSRFHRVVALILASGFFFESADLQLFGYLAPGLQKYMHFSIEGIATVTSASFLGMFVGGALGGWLSDRFGRRRMFFIAVAWYSVWSLLNAFGWNLTTVAVGRILTGVGLSCMAVSGITYLSEVMPKAYRGRIQAAVLATGLAGIPVITFISRAVVPSSPNGWRYMFAIGAVGIVTLVLASKVPESPRWVLVNNGSEEAEKILTGIESAVIAERGSLTAPEPAPPAPPEPGLRLAALFRGGIASRTWLLLGAWIFQTLALYGFMSWVPTLLVSHGFTISKSLTFAAITTIGAVPGALSAWLVSDRFGRKIPIVVTAVLAAVFGLVYGLSFQDLLIALFGFLLSFVMQAFVALLYAYTPELYPTNLRNSGSGFVYGAGRLANVGGPFIIAAIFNSAGYPYVFLFVTGCWGIVALAVAIWGPRTSKRSLEELQAAAIQPELRTAESLQGKERLA